MSLTASAVEVAGSIDDTTGINVTDGNKDGSSIKGQQGKVGGDNKYNDINDADIGKSDGEVGDDNDGNSLIDGNEVNKGGNNKVGDDNDNDGRINSNEVNKGGNNKVGDDNNGDGGIDGNEVNEGGNNGASSNDPTSEDDSSASSGSEGFIVAVNNEPGPCAWMSAHQCICAEQAPVLCKGNSTEMCLRTVHQECLLFWKRTQPA